MRNKKTAKNKLVAKGSIKNLFKNLPFKKVIYLSLILSAINIVLVPILSSHLPPEVPLFYGLPEGEGQLTNTAGLMIAGYFSFTVIVVNTLFALASNNEFIKKVLVLSEFVVAFMSLFTTIEIVLLVGVF